MEKRRFAFQIETIYIPVDSGALKRILLHSAAKLKQTIQYLIQNRSNRSEISKKLEKNKIIQNMFNSQTEIQALYKKMIKMLSL